MATVVFNNETEAVLDDLKMEFNCVLFHGKAVDDRGRAAINVDSDKRACKVLVEYNHERMVILFDGLETGADNTKIVLAPLVRGKNVFLESTTLGFAELFLLVKALVDIGCQSFCIFYVEPEKYSRTKPGADSFHLTALNCGYRPIPGAIVDLAGDDVEAGVFFLGFEPERLERAFEEYQMISSMDIKVVFGIPAFHPGWELNSIVPHLKCIGGCDVQYCAANDPSSAYDTLEVTRSSLGADKKMFVAPIGTKPCGIAAAIFASVNSSNVGLLFDHRIKMSKRSTGVGLCHKYAILISYA